MGVYNEASDAANPKGGLRLRDIPAHDPYVWVDEASGIYYLYTSGSPRLNGLERYGVVTYRSKDLLNWEGPFVVFTVPDNSWAHPMHGTWAPEVHHYSGKFYLFVTLHNSTKPLEENNSIKMAKHWRGTAIAVADHPEGPFQLLKHDAPVVSPEKMTLDGTLYVDENSKPWMVFCHEWIQTIDGTIEAIPLRDDLTEADGEPILLFKGSEAVWDTGEPTDGYDGKIHVTDGCQLYRKQDGSLIMLWASYDKGKYVQTHARSLTGKLEGPWKQLQPLVGDDSGHGMLFKTLEGELMLILHQPFPMPQSRCKLYLMEEKGEGLAVVKSCEHLHG